MCVNQFSPQKYLNTCIITQVTGSWDGKVTAWDMRMRRQVKVLHEHNERVWALAANEQRLASGGLDGMVMVYNFS